ncbi:TauD/TfdA family dioxygenase [Actinospica durhamensis]|uniref:TauD/TfdA family dioxygenase n=1 Tax=Actinospica durhamensis TaxID=1508375 RepID=A0A941IPS4_9ACTN|nr:TauD/TfdA family dioxygenase [Actinospica durhamensis]MBR7833427.1 TauD/TfdA family dioxygenase [Actinospica durhamensis]
MRATVSTVNPDRSVAFVGPRRLARTGPDAAENVYTRLVLHPLTGHIGAEVEGVDFDAALDAELAAELRAALAEWKVLFFRDQHEFDHAAHLALAAIWGEPEPNPFFGKTETAGISRLAKDASTIATENIWHSDHSFMAAPARGSILRAVEVPAAGGDTLWADMGAAYDNLTQELKDRLEGLRAVHDWEPSWGQAMTPDQIAALRPLQPGAEHPVVVRHPVTGRKTLYVNRPFTTHIVGMPEAESEELLRELFLQARVPEYQVRFRWQPGSVAIWDNIATQHYAINDYHPQRRVMERIAIAGVPLS